MTGTAREYSMLSPLRIRAYRHLFAAQLISLLGTGMTTVALSLLAFELSPGDAPAILGAVLALKMIAYVLIAPVAATMAAHVPRKVLLIGLDLFRAAVICTLPFVNEVWQILVLVFVINACSATYTPAFQALIPTIVEGEENYTHALSLSRIAFELEALVSPTVAAGVLTLSSLNLLFFADAGTFLISAAIVAGTALPAARTAELVNRSWRRVSHGVRKYLSVPRLRGLLALYLAVASASAMVIVNTVVIVRTDLGLGDTEVAWAFAASGAGSLAAVMAISPLFHRFSEKAVMTGGATLLIAGLVASALVTSYAMLLVAWFVVGIGLSVVQTPAGRLVQRSATTDDAPDLFAAQFSLSHACWLITYPVAGAVATATSIATAAIVLATIGGVGVVLALLLWREP